MSGIQLNLDFNGPSQDKKEQNACGNRNHERFVRRRHYLAKKGWLNKKQNANNCQKERFKKNKNHRQDKRTDSSNPGVVFPKLTTSPLELSTKPMNSMQARHEKPVSKTQTGCAVPSSSKSQKESSAQGMMPTPSHPMKYVAIDCEMVGTGPKGRHTELARCSIVSYNGDVIYDKFIKPLNPVTDLRTRWSGVRWKDLHNAIPFKEAQKEILKILLGKVVVGHAIHNDFNALHYSHPVCLTRDTSRIPILNQKAGLPEEPPPSLKNLTKILFNKDIQKGKMGHSSVEDARASMELYKIVEQEWETILASKAQS